MNYEGGSMEDVLLRIIVDQLCFLELSTEEIVNDDAAVRQVESIASELSSLPSSERARLSRMLVLLAGAGSMSDARSEFVRSLPGALGLSEAD